MTTGLSVTGSRRQLAAGLVVALAFSGDAFAQLPSPDKTAAAALADSPIPDATSFGFEGQLPVDGYVRGNWPGWTVGGVAGVSLGSGGLASNTQAAPQGDNVGWIFGEGTMTCSFTTTAGVGRVQLQAAQRVGDTQSLRVLINGTLAGSLTPDGSDYEHFSSRPIVVPTGATQVTLEGMEADAIAFFDAIRWEPLREWDDPSSWVPSGIPVAGETVLIPHGSDIAIDSQSCTAGSLRIEGSLLAANVDGRLDADDIRVGGGKDSLFEVGQEGAPFLEDFDLNLTGDPVFIPSTGELAPGQPAGGQIFLVVNRGGTLSLHGDDRPTRTRFDSLAPDGLSFSTTDPAPWEVGDEIVITGRRQQDTFGAPMGDCGAQAPTATYRCRSITSVGPNALSLDVNAALSLGDHVDGLGMPLSYDNQNNTWVPDGMMARTWEVDQRSYVGRLSRNIVITGTSAESATIGSAGSDDDGIGGHIMVTTADSLFPSAPEELGFYVEGVELRHMGQKGVLGRYPVHWHLMTDGASGHYLRNCSIHDSHNRAVTIHGTDGVSIKGNIVLGAIGHAMFLEDGAEQFNSFEENLVVGTVRPVGGMELIPSDNQHCDVQDRSPASFWITNPTNDFIGNVVTDTVGTAYWLALPQCGVRWPSSTLAPPHGTREPRSGNLGMFDGNVAVNCGSGFDMGDIILGTGVPNSGNQEDGETSRGTWNPTVDVTEITNFVAYGCYDGIYSAGMLDEKVVRFIEPILTDNVEALRIATGTEILGGLIDVAGGAIERGGYSTQNPDVGFAMYDGNAIIKQCHFVGFNGPSDSDPAAIRNSGGRSIGTARSLIATTFDGAAGSKPHVLYADYSNAPTQTPANELNNASYFGNPRIWGHTMRVADASAWMMPSIPYDPASRNVTIIGNHPLVVAPSAVVYSPAVPTFRALLSSDRYGFVRVMSGNSMQTYVPRMTLQRAANTRSTPQDPTTPIYEQFFITDPTHRMFPAIVVDKSLEAFEYRLGFPDTQALPPKTPEVIESLEFHIDGIEPSDSVVFRLQQGAFVGYTVTSGDDTLTPVADVNQLRLSQQTAYYVTAPSSSIPGTMFIKLVAESSESAVSVKVTR
ncbi:MAG: G8 domain-containing protein [Planctomycetota bacterium]